MMPHTQSQMLGGTQVLDQSRDVRFLALGFHTLIGNRSVLGLREGFGVLTISTVTRKAGVYKKRDFLLRTLKT